MTIKRIIAAAVAVATAGILGATAYAATTPKNEFYFSIEGRDDLYYGTSSGVSNNDWQNPAVVQVTYSNLSPTNKARISVTGDNMLPEDNVLSEIKTISGNGITTLSYNADYVVSMKVYLLATTGDDVSCRGYWEP